MADESDVADMEIVVDASTDHLRRSMQEADRLVDQTTRKIDRSLANVDGAFDRMASSTQSAAGVVRTGTQAMATDSAIAFSRISTSSNNTSRAVAADSQSMVRDFGTLSTAVKATAGIFAGFELVSSIKDAALLSARYNQLGIVVNTLGGNAGYSRAQLAEFQSGLQRTGISAIESRNNIAKMIAVQLDLANATKLARLAQDAAVIANTNSSEAFGNLVDGIASAEVETLRAMGLNTNFENGYKTLAAQLGKNVNDLSEQEKAQSRVNSALQAGVAIHGSYEASLSSASKILSSTKRYLQDLEVQLGQTYQPAFESGVNAYSDALKGLAGHTDEVTQVLKTGLYIALGQAATALASKAAATLDNARADVQAKAAAADAAMAEVRRIEALQAGNAAKMESARLNKVLAASEVEMKAAASALGAVRRQELLLENQLIAAKVASAEANATLAASTSLLGRTMTGLANTARGLWAALGGPVGLLFTAGAVALSFVDFSEKTETLKTTLGDLTTPLDQVVAKFQKLSEVEKDVELRHLGERILQLNKDMAQAGVDAAESFGSNLAIELMAQRGSIGVEGLLDLSGVGNNADQAAALVRTSFADAARGVNVDWTAVVEKLRTYNGVSAEMIAKVQDAAVALQQHQRELAETKARQDALNGSIREGAAAQAVSNAIVTDKAGQAYLDNLTKQAALAGKVTEVEKLRANIAAGFIKLDAEAEKAAYAAAAATDRINAAMKAATESRKASTKAAKDDAKATQDLLDRAFPEEKRLRDLVDNIKGLQELQAKGKITAEQYGQGLKFLNEQYAAPEIAKRTKEEEKAAAALKKTNDELQKLVDELDPASKRSRDYAEQQALLNGAIAKGGPQVTYYQTLLGKLNDQYVANGKGADQWAQFTEGAVDRVDDAFADAWKTIDGDFDKFGDGLKDSMKQLLAELAHMAITKPIVVQLGAALGVGGMSGSQGGSGTSTGSGGIDVGSLMKYGKSAYDFLSGTGSSIYNAYQSGGVQGVYNYGATALGNYFSAGATANSASAGATAAGYTSNAFSNYVAMQNAGTFSGAATSLGSIAGGLSGAYMGYQNAGVKGAVAGGLGGWGGGTLGGMAGSALVSAIGMGATLGSIVPVIGTAIGAALGAAFGSKLFGGAWQTKDNGIALGVTGGDLDANSFTYQKKKGGLFSSNKKRTLFGALPDEQAAALQDTYDTTQQTVEELYTRLGVTMHEGVLAGLNVGRTQISTKDKTDEEIQKEITAWFEGVADSMTSAINDATGTGLGGYNFEALRTFVNNLYGVNDAIRYLNVGLYDTSVAGGRLAESLAATAGGLQALQTNTATYFDQFFSDTEKANATLDTVTRAFKSADTVLPETREGFRKAVEALDLTTDSGQAMFSTLMALAGQADAYYDVLEQRSTSLAQSLAQAQSAMLGGALENLQRAVQRQQTALTAAYNVQSEELNTSLSASQSVMSSLTTMANGLASALKTLQSQSDAAKAVLYQQAQATLVSAAAIARAGGSIAGLAGIDDALSAITSNDAGRYANWEDFSRDQGRSLVLVAELNKAAGGQLDKATQTYNAIQEQIRLAKSAYEMESTKLQGQLDLAQAQIDGINGIDTRLLSVNEALAEILKAISTASPNGTGAKNADSIIEAAYRAALGRSADAAGAAYWKQQLASGAVNSNNLSTAIAAAGAANAAAAPSQVASAYSSILGREPTAADMAYWTGQVANGGVHDVYAAIRAAAIANGQIPGYALGGNHAGGFRIVGENGPELELTGPSRIFSASQTAQAFAGAGGGWQQVVTELKAQRQELTYLRQQLVDINDNTGQASRRLRDMSIAGGQPA
ncbi:DUF4214 domain-containing protein [Pseudomonas oryzihabitans]|uniref:DUF4214 domain-containing protein n=1 Tax=Pseudomonas oryzihabitans TaxID=47885 RepID=UPI0028A161F9|nr:DUF4214 domain-containing protein [Pseudomonas oryzihabitans]